MVLVVSAVFVIFVIFVIYQKSRLCENWHCHQGTCSPVVLIFSFLFCLTDTQFFSKFNVVHYTTVFHWVSWQLKLHDFFFFFLTTMTKVIRRTEKSTAGPHSCKQFQQSNFVKLLGCQYWENTRATPWSY